jgi:hypothetical protein
MRSRLVGLLLECLVGLPLLVASGCRATFTCDPACAAGYHCDDTGACVSDGTGPGGDGGHCSPACSGLTPYCNPSGGCVACLADADCPLGLYCKGAGGAGATCVIGCSDDSRCGGAKCCDHRCADTTSDGDNCGACGQRCASPHERSTCVNSTCVPAGCEPGYGDCNGDPADGCEANLHIDLANCSACGVKCALPNAVSACADGCYIAACDPGFADCNNNMRDGCETNVSSDPSNCNACGFVCIHNICNGGVCQ